jgi:hypothetical protein
MPAPAFILRLIFIFDPKSCASSCYSVPELPFVLPPIRLPC